MPFDLEAARKAGKTDQEIAAYLSGQSGFDYEAATKAGKTPTEIAQYLATTERPSLKTSFSDRPHYGAQAVENFPSSFLKLMKNIVTPVAHDVGAAAKGLATGKPQSSDVLGAIATPLLGLQQKMFPSLAKIQQDRGTPNAAPVIDKLAEPITKSIQDPAGVPKRLAEFSSKDPAQALMNLSMLLTGVGKATGSKALGETATALDPVNMAAKATGAIAKPLGSLGRSALGFTTGKRSPIVNQLYATLKAGGDQADTARKYLRGKLEAEDAIGEYKGALKAIRDDQLTNYQAKLKELDANPTAAIDMTDLHNALTKKLYDYDVRIGKKGQLDFSRSKAFAANAQGQQDVKMITDIIRGWGKKKGDNTPFMLDTLRGILQDFYSPSGKSREFATALKNIVKDKVEEKVPGYKKTMLEPYEKRQELFEDSKKLFSIKNPNDRRVNADLVLKKLQRAMTEDPEYARDFIGKIEAESGKSIKSMIAAYSMAPSLPGGIVGRGMLGGSLYEMARHGIAKFDPHLAIMVGMASPRAVGEFLNVAAKVTRGAGKAAELAKTTTVGRQAMAQVGALSSLLNQYEQSKPQDREKLYRDISKQIRQLPKDERREAAKRFSEINDELGF